MSQEYRHQDEDEHALCAHEIAELRAQIAERDATIAQACEIMQHARYRNHQWAKGCAMCDALVAFIAANTKEDGK